MNETKALKTENKTRRKRMLATVNYSAEEKTQAVLAVWTEKARSSEVCRQMSVNWITFNHWQRRAMEGMLQALECRVNLAKGEALSPRLQALLNKRQRTVTGTQLSSRLEKIQQGKSREEAARAN
jgi:transposase-like protein